MPPKPTAICQGPGCSESLAGKSRSTAKYHNAACRYAAWKAHHKPGVSSSSQSTDKKDDKPPKTLPAVLADKDLLIDALAVIVNQLSKDERVKRVGYQLHSSRTENVNSHKWMTYLAWADAAVYGALGEPSPYAHLYAPYRNS